MAHHFGGFFVQTLQPLTQRPQRPFSYRNGLFVGELRADDRVTMNVPVYTEPPLTHIPMTTTMKYNRNQFQFITSFWNFWILIGRFHENNKQLRQRRCEC